MQYAGKILRWLGIALAAVLFLLVAVFGLLQTQIGKGWLEREIAQGAEQSRFHRGDRTASAGFVPFRMTVERIEIGDRDGTYLTLHDVGLDISAAALLARRAHIRSLTFAEIEMARSSTAPSTTPFTDYLKVPHLPVGVVLDRLSIGRLALAPPVLGESLVATVEGSAELVGETAHVTLDLHRIDGSAGNVLLAMELAGATPVLSLRLEAAEPTGILLDRLLGRTDRPPLALSVNGTGPLADWHGRVSASAGALARFDADVTLAVAAETGSRAVGHGGIGAAASGGVRIARRRPGCALAARELRRPDRGRPAVHRNRGGHLDRAMPLLAARKRLSRRIFAPTFRSSRRWRACSATPSTARQPLLRRSPAPRAALRSS